MSQNRNNPYTERIPSAVRETLARLGFTGGEDRLENGIRVNYSRYFEETHSSKVPSYTEVEAHWDITESLNIEDFSLKFTVRVYIAQIGGFLHEDKTFGAEIDAEDVPAEIERAVERMEAREGFDMNTPVRVRRIEATSPDLHLEIKNEAPRKDKLAERRQGATGISRTWVAGLVGIALWIQDERTARLVPYFTTELEAVTR
jgi:hypothetical protein